MTFETADNDRVYHDELTIYANSSRRAIKTGVSVVEKGVPNMSVDVQAGTIYFNSTEVAVTGVNVAITASDPSLGRLDLIVVNSAGVVSVIDGTADLDPRPPAFDIDIYVILARIIVGNGVTAIYTANIKDLRAIFSAGGSGTVTDVSSANADIGVATGTTTPVLTLNSGTGANQIPKRDGSGILDADTLNGLITGTSPTNIIAFQIDGKYPAGDGSNLTNLPGNASYELCHSPYCPDPSNETYACCVECITAYGTAGSVVLTNCYVFNSDSMVTTVCGYSCQVCGGCAFTNITGGCLSGIVLDNTAKRCTQTCIYRNSVATIIPCAWSIKPLRTVIYETSSITAAGETGCVCLFVLNSGGCCCGVVTHGANTIAQCWRFVIDLYCTHAEITTFMTDCGLIRYDAAICSYKVVFANPCIKVCSCGVVTPSTCISCLSNTCLVIHCLNDHRLLGNCAPATTIIT